MNYGKILDYGTPAGWVGLGMNKAFGTPTLGSVATEAVNDLSGKKGLETAAQGAREAQAQANALAQLQWQRQMQGLQEARGQTQPYLSLYDKIYGTQMAGKQTPVGGLSIPGGGTPPPGAPQYRPDGLPDPYDTWRGVLPDGTRAPASTKPPGERNPTFAPVMVGRPPGAVPQSNPSRIPALTQQTNDPLMAYLRSRGAML